MKEWTLLTQCMPVVCRGPTPFRHISTEMKAEGGPSNLCFVIAIQAVLSHYGDSHLNMSGLLGSYM